MANNLPLLLGKLLGSPSTHPELEHLSFLSTLAAAQTARPGGWMERWNGGNSHRTLHGLHTGLEDS